MCTLIWVSYGREYLTRDGCVGRERRSSVAWVHWLLAGFGCKSTSAGAGGKAGATWSPRQLADGGTRATQLLLFAHGVTARKGKKKNLRFYFFAFPGVGP